MPYQAAVFNVMIASPGDVAQERLIVRDVIQDWNAAHSKRRGIVLQAIGWDSHSYPSMEDEPQGVLNKQILGDADLLVAVFWTRVGTPTKDAVSGTVEEIERHIGAGRHAMIYFSDVAIPPSLLNPEQYQRLQDFKKLCMARGLIEKYASHVEFKDKFSQQLAIAVNHRPQFVAHQAKAREQSSVPFDFKDFEQSMRGMKRDKLSPEAAEILLHAIDDPHGQVLRRETIGGVEIITCNKNFVPENDPRASARWDAALNELWKQNLLKLVRPYIYQVTHEGYEVADLVRADDL